MAPASPPAPSRPRPLAVPTTVAGERLDLLLDLTRGLSTFSDLAPLLQYVTDRLRSLFGAEGASLLLLDPVSNEFFFPFASEGDLRVEDRLRQVRFPADQGIAGWILKNDRAEMVADVPSDPRFFQGVDTRTDFHTQSILGAPLRTPQGNIGVVEIVNPDPRFLNEADLEFLEVVAGDVATACEKARLYERLRAEVVGLRQVCRVAGTLLATAGVILGGWTVLSHLVRSLPWESLPTRDGVVPALLSLVGGWVLLQVASGRLLRSFGFPR